VRIPAARFSDSDWLHLDDEHDEDAYDLVLVLGNSLCHLGGPRELKIAIDQFARRLRSGGALVCDERNFDYVVKSWSSFASDPWNKFRFNSRPAEERVMYYGDTVLSVPIEKTGTGRVIFSYAEVERDENGRATPVPGGELGTLSMYPFARGEMVGVLRNSGQFGKVEIYSDLRPTVALDESADFYTYVAWKA
jgi:hypothetical protein